MNGKNKTTKHPPLLGTWAWILGTLAVGQGLAGFGWSPLIAWPLGVAGGLVGAALLTAAWHRGANLASRLVPVPATCGGGSGRR